MLHVRDAILKATLTALNGEYTPRHFATERGYHGRFYCLLQGALDLVHGLPPGALLEIEYQKAASIHDMGQRPDIVYHVPREHSHAPADENNYAVWALKRQATASRARLDFDKLDAMIAQLRYPLAVFINVASEDHLFEHYQGPHAHQVVAAAVTLLNGVPMVRLGGDWLQVGV